MGFPICEGFCFNCFSMHRQANVKAMPAFNVYPSSTLEGDCLALDYQCKDCGLYGMHIIKRKES